MDDKYFRLDQAVFKVSFDEDGIPESCYKLDKNDGTFKECDTFLPDVIESASSRLISKDEIDSILAKV